MYLAYCNRSILNINKLFIYFRQIFPNEIKSCVGAFEYFSNSLKKDLDPQVHTNVS